MLFEVWLFGVIGDGVVVVGGRWGWSDWGGWWFDCFVLVVLFWLFVLVVCLFLLLA